MSGLPIFLLTSRQTPAPERFCGRLCKKFKENMLTRKVPLKIAIAEHPHTAQNPEVLDIAAMSRKNKVGA